MNLYIITSAIFWRVMNSTGRLERALESLEVCFTSDKPNIKNEYWHWVVKNKGSEAFYAKQEELQKKVDLYGIELLEAVGPHGWTPLHVACLKGNVPGAGYLLGQKVSSDVVDEFGNTPQFYAKRYPEITALFKKKHVDPIPESKFNFESSSFTAMAHTDDFGLNVKKLHFSGDCPQNIVRGRSIAHTISNMRVIAADEGFELSVSKHSYYPRDHLITLSDGFMISGSSQDLPAISDARKQALSRSIYFNEHPISCMHNAFQGLMGAGSQEESVQRSLLDFQSIYETDRPEFRFFVDGGDVFTLTNNRGERTVLLGRDQLFAIHAECRKKKLFDEKGITIDLEAIELNDQLVSEAAEEMFAMGLLKMDQMSGYIGDDQFSQIQQIAVNFGEENPSSYRDLAVLNGIIPKFQISASNLEAAKPIIRKYLAQRRVVFELLAKSFGVSSNHIHLVPKAAFHLDNFLFPGPRKSICIQDYNVCEEVLNSILEKADALQLSEDEKEILGRYLSAAQTLNQRLSPLLQKARRALMKAGFEVIPVPGAFYDDSWIYRQMEGPTHHVNFMNAISGYSKKNKRPYLITNGAQVGSKLGKLLMAEFEKALHKCQPDLQVHFIGQNPETGDFLEAMMLWNGKGQREELNAVTAGVHCLSKELITASNRC